MAQGLQLSQRMALSQVLAPQLQQSLALLQAPTLELKALVEQELQVNPVLEEEIAADQDQEDKDSENSLDGSSEGDDGFEDSTQKEDSEPVDEFRAEFEKLVELDQEWRDHFSQTNIPLRSNQDEEEKRQFMFDSLVAGTSLQEILQDQLRMSELRPNLIPTSPSS
jgi:RNA polymerase sigma-54 factor